jgi:hypothetical protein
MTVFNLTPHSIDIYPQDVFVGLTQVNPTTWTAESVVEAMAYKVYPSFGSCRIKTSTVAIEAIDGVPTVSTEYGELEGIPVEATLADTLIVSLPAQSMAKASGSEWAEVMVAPYKVVRLASNTSVILGCMGFTK